MLQGLNAGPPVHWSDWASQPNIRIACTKEYTTPAWGGNALPNVYLADNKNLYTFDASHVTCKECLGIIATYKE